MARRKNEEEPEGAESQDSTPQSGEQDISGTPAPSVGPHTTFEKDSPQERLAKHDQSDTDAMGLDKRREVIGGTYGPTVGRQAAMYGIAIAVVAVIGVGGYLLAKEFDQPPDKYEDKAPWSQAGAEQTPPTEIDFPNYGHPGDGESAQATPGETSGDPTSENAAGVETP